MRLQGYCWKCHKVRNVRVELPPTGRVVPIGICQECEDKESGPPERAVPPRRGRK
jgi:hypothetical protein